MHTSAKNLQKSNFTKITDRQLKTKITGFSCFNKVDLIAAILDDSKVAIYRLSWEVVHLITLPGERKTIHLIEWCPDGKELAILCQSGQLFFADVDLGKIVYTLSENLFRASCMEWKMYDFKKCEHVFQDFKRINSYSPTFDFLQVTPELKKFREKVFDFEYKRTSLLLVGTPGVVYCLLYGRLCLRVNIGDHSLNVLFAGFNDAFDRMYVVVDKKTQDESSEKISMQFSFSKLSQNLPNLFRLSAESVILSEMIGRERDVIKSIVGTWTGMFSQFEKLMQGFIESCENESGVLYYHMLSTLLCHKNVKMYEFMQSNLKTTTMNKLISKIEASQTKGIQSILLLFFLAYTFLVRVTELRAFIMCALADYIPSLNNPSANPINDCVAFSGVFITRVIRLLFAAKADGRDSNNFFCWFNSNPAYGITTRFDDVSTIFPLINRLFENTDLYEGGWTYPTRVAQFFDNMTGFPEGCVEVEAVFPKLIEAVKGETGCFSSVLNSPAIFDRSFDMLLADIDKSLELVFDHHNYDIFYEAVVTYEVISELSGDVQLQRIAFFDVPGESGMSQWLAFTLQDPFGVLFLSCEDMCKRVSISSFPFLSIYDEKCVCDMINVYQSRFVIMVRLSESIVLVKVDFADFLSNFDGELIVSNNEYELMNVGLDRVCTGGERNYALLTSSTTNGLVTLIFDINEGYHG